MEKGSSRISRFRQVMYLVMILGLCTNAFIVALFLYLSVYEALYSPIVGSILFVLGYVLMTKNVLTVKQAFLITSYTVAVEVIIHTHYLGWDAGFFYYFFLISLVFLLDYSWRIRSVILFNGSILAMTIATIIIYKGKDATHIQSENFITNLSLFNQGVVASVILVITIYFSNSQQSKDKELMDVNLELEAQNKEISEQRNHLQILLKEVHHRVKNNLQIISSLLSLQSRSVKDKEALAVLDKSQRRIEAIALIHQNLYANKPGNVVDFKSYIHELIKSQQLIQSDVICNVNFQDSTLDLDFAVPLGLIISEMMTNSVKHAFKDSQNPKIDISFLKNKEGFNLIFKDNGVGFPEGFTIESSASLGIEIIVALVDQIDANISFQNDNGAEIKITYSSK